jgi:hypothetical protein
MAPEMDVVINPGWKPALADQRLRGRAAVILVSRPFVDPYVAIQPPPSVTALARTLAARLRETGVLVVQMTVRSPEPGGGDGTHHKAGGLPPILVLLQDSGDTNGEPFDSVNSAARLEQSPTLFVVDSREVVRAVFEGRDAWNAVAVEAAARRVAPSGGPRSNRLPGRRLAAE